MIDITLFMFKVVLGVCTLFWFIVLCLYCDENLSGFVIFAMWVLSIVVIFGLTPSIEQMEANGYVSTLNSRPECMASNADGHDLNCLLKYREWLDDSLEARVKLDSIDSVRLKLMDDIRFKLRPQDSLLDTIKDKE